MRASRPIFRRLISAALLFAVSAGPRAQTESEVFERAKARFQSALTVSDEARRKGECLRSILDLKEFIDTFPVSSRIPEAQLLVGDAYRALARDSRDADDANRALHYYRLVERGDAAVPLRGQALDGIGAVCDETLRDRACKREAVEKKSKLSAKAPEHEDLSVLDLTELAKERAQATNSPVLSPAVATVRALKTDARGGDWTLKVELDQPVPAFTSKFLAAPAKAGTPPRFYVDLGHTKLPPTVTLPAIAEQSAVQSVRLAQNTLDRVRLVFDLHPAVKEGDFEVRSQERMLLISVKKASLAAAVAAPPVLVPPSDSDAMIAPRGVKAKKRYRIIVDPGHGGDDPGARGPKGTSEKDVCLDIALRLRELLLKNPKYEVLMTRETDRTLALGDRTRFANKAEGDLFVSVHANASPKRTAKGVSTYFLHNADDQESLRVAMRENGELAELPVAANDSEDHYLEVMKASMVKNFHTVQSTDLARQVQASMLSELRAGYRDVHDIGVRSARFYVLTGAQMPAVLVETSFISNPTEEARLKNASYQNTLARSIVKGVDKFFKLQEKSPTHPLNRG